MQKNIADIYDVVGIGFGPSNLALAVCIHEKIHEAGVKLKSIFFEKQNSFCWHRNMLIDDATLQVSFLKDLVTLRNPTSQFSFLNYLKAVGRLEEFINLKTFFPTRIEFNEYLKWVADQLYWLPKYSSQVEEIKPVAVGDEIRYFDISVRDTGTGSTKTYRAKNLVVGVGLHPLLPSGVHESARVFHNAALLRNIEHIDKKKQQRFLVVGGGQSAAETVNYLYDNFKNSNVSALFSGFGYKPADDSYFVNQIFDNDNVDLFYDAPEPIKEFLLTEHRNTNYGVVDLVLIEELYKKFYSDRIKNTKRLSFRRLSRLQRVEESGDGVRAHIHNIYSNSTYTENFDAIILATGYKSASLSDLSPAMKPYLELNKSGEEVVDRYYAIKTTSKVLAKIYMQGTTEKQHGLTSTLLSALACRSQEIVESILSDANQITVELSHAA